MSIREFSFAEVRRQYPDLDLEGQMFRVAYTRALVEYGQNLEISDVDLEYPNHPSGCFCFNCSLNEAERKSYNDRMRSTRRVKAENYRTMLGMFSGSYRSYYLERNEKRLDAGDQRGLVLDICAKNELTKYLTDDKSDELKVASNHCDRLRFDDDERAELMASVERQWKQNKQLYFEKLARLN